MTPQEIEAQAAALQQLLTAHGASPEEALMMEGRDRARPRFQRALDRAQRYGYEDLASRIEGMIETEAQGHARRGMRRMSGRGGIGSDAVASPPVVAPLPPVASQPAPTLAGTETGPARNPTEAFIEDAPGSALGIDWGSPRPAFASSSLPEVAGTLPDWYRRGRVSKGMAARPLMPQSRLEEMDQEAANAALGIGYETGLQAASAAVPMGRAVEGAAAVGRGVGNLAAMAPRTTAATAGAVGLTAGASEAGPQDPVQTATSNLATLRATGSALAQEIQGLEALARNPTKAAVQGLQRTLGLKDDGVWGDFTRAAFERHRAERLAQQKENAESITQARTRLAQAERAQRREEAVGQLMPWERFAVERPGLVNTAALVAGGALPNVARSTGSAIGAAMTRWNRNRMISPTAPTEARVAGVNRFYSEGGGQEPFRIDPAAPAGFVPVARQQSGANLFPEPPRPGYRAGDAAAAATLAGVAGRAGYQYFGEARQELEDARKAADANPSKENMDRLAQAEYRATMTGAAFSGATGAALGTAAYPLMRPQFSARPNVQRAGAEVQQINNMLRQERNNGPWPTLEARRRDRNFSLPRDAPVNPADVPPASSGMTGEVWASEAGQKMVTRRSNGTWSEPGVRGSAKPPQERRGWRRIAGTETESNYLADFATVG